MKVPNSVLLVAACLMLGLSCTKDFVLEDINDKSIVVNAPANNLVSSENTITFWWEVLEGAEKYNIQIVKPDFANVIKLVADTNITSNKYSTTLQPGNYQWRIKAINGGGATAYQVYNLKIDSTTNLANQVVIPISPLTGYNTRDKTILFQWNTLPNAVTYSIELSQNNSVVHYTTTTLTNYTYSFSISSAANYTCSWRVRALNDNSISNYNTAQTFTIDLLPPSVSSPLTPTLNSLVRDTTQLKWNRLGGTDTQLDSLFVYTDAGFLNLIRTTTTSATSIRINEISTTNPLPAGTGTLSPIPYWWRLKSVDSKGNTSGFSNSLSFQLYQ
jgi:hypothetical protein